MAAEPDLYLVGANRKYIKQLKSDPVTSLKPLGAGVLQG